jgi:hypothetical protein
MLILRKDDYKERDHSLLTRVGLAPKDCNSLRRLYYHKEEKNAITYGRKIIYSRTDHRDAQRD